MMFWSTVSRLVPSILLFASCVVMYAEEPPTLESNLEYRLERGDLGDPDEIVPAPAESRRALRIEGDEQLLKLCLDDPAHWKRDPFLFRLGHKHPLSSVGCRERTSPSLHAVFQIGPEHTHETWVHFDLHGPQNVAGYLSEVVRNQLTFGRTSEYDVYRGLVRNNAQRDESAPAPRYDTAAQIKQYLRATFGSSAAGFAVASAAVGSAMHGATGWGAGRYTDQVSTDLVRHTVSESIEFGTSVFLQQDQGFSRSSEYGFRRRARAALYHSLFAPGRNGDELAFPRIAAAFGTPWAMRDFHPGRDSATNPWVQSAALFGCYIVRSYWTEFRPEITRAIHKILR